MTQVKKIGPGSYETEAGHRIEFYRGIPAMGTSSGWFITYPGEQTPDVTRPTLREAREYIATTEAERR